MAEIKSINLSYVVSSENAGDVENIFRSHASWMTEFYSEENSDVWQMKTLLTSLIILLKSVVSPVFGGVGDA